MFIIKGILYFCLAVGNYWECSSSKIVQFLCKTYCVIYIGFSVIIYFSMGYDAGSLKSKYDINLYIFFIINGCFALCNKQKYFTRFNSGIKTLDKIINFKRPKPAWIVAYVTLTASKSLIDFINYFIFKNQFLPFLANQMAEISRTISNLPAVIIYVMLWSRMEFLRKWLNSRLINGNVEEKQFSLRKFLQLYKSLLDNVKKVYNILAIQALIELVYYFVKLLADIQTALIIIGLDKNNWDIPLVILVISMIDLGLMLSCPLILQLTLNEYDNLTSIISTELMKCKDAAYREQIVTTLEYLEARPPRYTIWRIIPMNLKQVVMVFDVLVSYVIILLSFQLNE